MLCQLQSSNRICGNSCAIALSVYNFPIQYSLKQYVASLRYLLDTYNSKFEGKYPYPPKTNIYGRVRDAYNTARANNFLFEYREIIDIVFTYYPERIAEFNIENEYVAAQQLRQHVPRRSNNKKTAKNIYGDTQTVHNGEINRSVLKAASVLIKKYRHDGLGNVLTRARSALFARFSHNSVVINSTMNSIEKNFSFFGDSKFTISDAFCAVYCFIETHDDEEIRDELMKRMMEEILDMNGFCSTGHLARVVNIVQGFIEEKILPQIKISNKERATAIITHKINSALQLSDDEKIVDGLLDHNDTFIKFIAHITRDYMPEWISDLEISKEVIVDIVKRKYLI